MEARGRAIKELRYVLACLAQIIANTLMGGLAFAVVGAICGAGAVIIVSLFDFGALGEGAFIGVPIGAIVGFTCGIAGIFIHLFCSLRAEPDDFWRPFLELTARVACGQFWGTLSACTAYLVFELIYSTIRGNGFSAGVSEDLLFFAFGAPLIMIFGAIIAAVLKRD